MKRCLFLFACIFLFACASHQDDKRHSLQGKIFGTYYAIKYVAEEGTPANSKVEAAILARLNEIDAVMSTWKEDSELSRLNRAAQNVPVKLSEELKQMLLLSLQLNRQTLGAFDVTVGPLVNLWGFGAGGELTSVPDEASILATKKITGADKLRLDSVAGTVTKLAPIYLDLSAIAKGYAVDEAGEILNAMDVQNYLVEIGGEILARGHRPSGRSGKSSQQPWRIAIESPVADLRDVQRIVNLSNLGMATSGDYRNYFEQDGVRYSHIIDPTTGRPAQHTLASVSVVHPQTVIADAWATALLVLGEERGRALAEQHGIAAYFIRREGDKGEEFVESLTDAFAPLTETQ